MGGLASVAGAAKAAAVAGVVDVFAGGFEFAAGARVVVGYNAGSDAAYPACGVSGKYLCPEGAVFGVACVAAFGACSACPFACGGTGCAWAAAGELSAAWRWA